MELIRLTSLTITLIIAFIALAVIASQTLGISLSHIAIILVGFAIGKTISKRTRKN